MQNETDNTPLLIYDGDCDFCSYWVRYWKGLTGARVNYVAYQSVADQYPSIKQEEFQKAIQYIDKEGNNIASAAEASYLVLSHAPEKAYWLKLYRTVPGFASLAEFFYAFVAKRRLFFHKVSLALWGKYHMPARYELLSWIFLRLLGLIFLVAFVSFGVQALTLIGSQGVLPLSEFIANIRSSIGIAGYWHVPMIFWISASDFLIQLVCWLGAGFSLLLIAGILPRLSLAMLYIFYLSLIYAGQRFMSFQWDLMLVEIGFLALILTVAIKPGIWLLRFMIFRFMFVSGVVKIASGDQTWRDLTALNYHFETQPLPTPLAYYAHHLPETILRFGTGLTLFIELIVPFLIFMPRKIRFAAAFCFLVFQFIILLTGNYNFFNLLAIVLCLMLFDDAAVKTVISSRLVSWIKQRAKVVRSHKMVAIVAYFMAFWTVSASFIQFNNRFFDSQNIPAVLQWIDRSIAPLYLVSTYGPFSIMTTQRPEIIIEGSDDGQLWQAYTLKYKPGDIKRGTFYNIPHQPRIDWQLWFAALDDQNQNPWFARLLERILEDKPVVKSLFAYNPFLEEPPRFVRAMLYHYYFASPEQRAKENIYWRRELIGTYFPAVQLK